MKSLFFSLALLLAFHASATERPYSETEEGKAFWAEIQRILDGSQDEVEDVSDDDSDDAIEEFFSQAKGVCQKETPKSCEEIVAEIGPKVKKASPELTEQQRMLLEKVTKLTSKKVSELAVKFTKQPAQPVKPAKSKTDPVTPKPN